MKRVKYSRWDGTQKWRDLADEELASRLFKELSNYMNWSLSAQEAMEWLMRQGLEKLNIGESPGEMASAVEFILEGLHLHNRLNKEFLDGKIFYNEANKVQPLGRNSEMA